jgi:fucose 4-O-acetylase-like acetyltransferase
MSALRPRINYVLNVLLFIDVVLIMYTGIMISESFVPFLGIRLSRNFNMRMLHDLTANLFVLILGLHTALHWDWIVNAFKRYIFQPVGRLFASRHATQSKPVHKREV